MSLIKELCFRSDSQNSDSFSDCFVNKFESKEDNYRRDSFDDRFCDDLCEVLLQFLPFIHKLRLESVSKQFQRTVLQREYEVNIHMGAEENGIYWKIKQIFITKTDHNIDPLDTFQYDLKNQSLDSIKSLLKKCPNITSIQLNGPDLGCRGYDFEKVNIIFLLITENCNNLSEIKVLNHILLDESVLEEFHQKFGPKIKYLTYSGKLFDFSRFPKIEKIICLVKHVINHSIIHQLKTNKLKELDIAFNHGENHMLKTLIENFPTLTHLSVYFRSNDENAIYKSLKNISNLKHLIHFKLHIPFGINNNLFCGLLKQMANQNLKSIDFDLYIKRNHSDIRQFFSQFKTFPALKRLNLSFRFYYNEGEDNIDVNQILYFKVFKGFSNITHLSLVINGTQLSKELKFKDIDINLPKLQYLEISNKLNSTPEGVQQMAEILSRLSRLETLKLWFKTGVDLKPIEEQITEMCRKIRKIQIRKSD